MQTIKLKVLDAEGHTCMTCDEDSDVSLVYTNTYQKGDRIVLECRSLNCFCWIQFEDTLSPALVYLTKREISYSIPFDNKRAVFSPKAFTGNRHLIRARLATDEEIHVRRNLAFNPYDQHESTDCFPHTSANVETRGEAIFASYNAVDGIFENKSHGEWPYQSWGINCDSNAAWKLDFGRTVTLDELRITLRADFPHDSWWSEGTVYFSDGSIETLFFKKTGKTQIFPISPRTVTYLSLQNLINSEESSPFPALTQFEAFGNET